MAPIITKTIIIQSRMAQKVLTKEVMACRSGKISQSPTRRTLLNKESNGWRKMPKELKIRSDVPNPVPVVSSNT